MKDSSETEANKEAVMDFVISWMVRYAAYGNAIEKPQLYQYCRRFLSLLVERELKDTTQIVKVETWKQWDHIDLWVSIVLTDNGNEERHEILIEDKVYSKLFIKNLIKYRNSFDTYLQKNVPSAIKHYHLLTCFEIDDAKISKYDKAKSEGFKVISWNEMKNAMKITDQTQASESDIFNEFWMYNW